MRGDDGVNAVLEERPVLKNSIAGVGAFSFVFLAAMMGTAFMLTGGFGPIDPPRSTPPETRGFVVLEPAVAQEWTRHTNEDVQLDDIAPSAEEGWLDDHEFQEAVYESELAGSPADAPAQRVILSEADISRDITRSFAADYTADSSEAWEQQRARYNADYAYQAVSSPYPADKESALY